MRIIPAKPKLDAFEARVVGSYSDTSGKGSANSMFQGVLNIPVVSETLALRAVGYRYDESGYYQNIAGEDAALIAAAESRGVGDFVRGFVQDDVGRIVSTGGRLSALWKVTERLGLSATYVTQLIEQDGSPQAWVGKFEQSIAPIAVQGRVRNEEGDVNDTDMDLANIVLSYDLGWAALTSVASWVDADSAYATGLASSFALALGPYSGRSLGAYESFSAETRVASQFAGPVQVLAGLYYEDVKNVLHSSSNWPGTAATNPLPSIGLPATNPLYLATLERDLIQRAIFGEVSYQLTGKLTAKVGGRYFEYDIEESRIDEGGFAGVPLGAGAVQLRESSDDGSSFKADLSYKPTRDSLLYASWSEGFRLGRPDAGAGPLFCDADRDGFVDSNGVSIESTRSIESDSLENYEIGWKFAFLDGRMTLDTSIFHINWDGLPIRVTPQIRCSYFANAGAAKSDGAEVHASFIAKEGLRFEIGAGFTNAELSRDAPGLPGSPTRGARLPGSPKVSANLSAQYDFRITGIHAFVRADSLYIGKFYGDLLQTEAVAAGDYIKVDVRGGVTLRDLRVELYVRNLTNEDDFTWRGTSAQGEFFGYRLRPRTIGVQLGYAF